MDRLAHGRQDAAGISIFSGSFQAMLEPYCLRCERIDWQPAGHAESRGHGSDGLRPQCLDVNPLIFDEAERDVRQNSLEHAAQTDDR